MQVPVVQVVEGGFPSWSGPTTPLSLPPSISHQHHLTHRDLAGGVRRLLPPTMLESGISLLPHSLVQVCVLACLPP